MPTLPTKNFLSLDIGSKRIGLARANSIARLSEPIAVIANDRLFKDELAKLAHEHGCDILIVGLPRNLSGEETAQSAYVRQFVDEQLDQYKVVFQDETLSTVESEQRLASFGLKDRPEMIDAVAACIILEDYLKNLS